MGVLGGSQSRLFRSDLSVSMLAEPALSLLSSSLMLSLSSLSSLEPDFSRAWLSSDLLSPLVCSYFPLEDSTWSSLGDIGLAHGSLSPLCRDTSVEESLQGSSEGDMGPVRDLLAIGE